MMRVSDIPKELQDKIREQFNSSPKVQMLRVQQGVALRNGRFDESLRLERMLDEVYSNVLYSYMKEAEESVERIDIEKLDIDAKAKEHIMTCAIVLFMCTDVIETAVMDIDDTLHKESKELRFELFDDLRKVASMAKEKLQFLREHSDYMKDLVWADKCDDMYEMMSSKARSIRRKKLDSPDWGKNNPSAV